MSTHMTSLFWRAKGSFDALTDLGVASFDDPNEAKRVSLTNKIAATMMLICVPYVFVYAAMGLYWLAACMPVVMATGVLVPMMNRRGTWRAFAAARLMLFVNFAVSIGLYSAVLGHGSMTHLAWFAGACLPFLLCDIKERGLIALGMASQLLAYGFLELGGRGLLPPPAVGEQIQYLLGVTMVPTAFGMLLMMVGYFATASKRAEVAMHRRNRDLRMVLDNVDQAFLTADAAGILAGERSSVCDTWFEPAAEGQTLWSLLGGLAPETAAMLELSWEELWQDILPLELVLDQLPGRFEAEGRTFGIAYKPIFGGGALRSVLVIITELTAEIERERAEQAQREIVELYQRLMRDRSGFLEFVEEAGNLVSAVAGAGGLAGPELARALHTLKGNCGLYGVTTMAALCHELEQRLEDAPETFDAQARESLSAAWSSIMGRLDGMLGERSADVIEVERAEYERLARAVRAQVSHPELAEIIDPWDRVPTAAHLRRLGEQAQALARRLGKGEIAVEMHDHGHRVDADAWRPFWSALVHVIRNCVDHGIERPEVRRASGKPAQGSVQLATFVEGETFVVSVSDDGAGIDWNEVEARAGRAGLPRANRRDLERALFADGVSTRDEVTDVSGRGVGLAAVLAVVEGFGGRVVVRSQPGAGTTFEFRTPVASMTGVSFSVGMTAAAANARPVATAHRAGAA